MKKEIFINETRPHESAIKHVSGKAYYTDDIPEPPGTLFLTISKLNAAHTEEMSSSKRFDTLYALKVLFLNRGILIE